VFVEVEMLLDASCMMRPAHEYNKSYIECHGHQRGEDGGAYGTLAALLQQILFGFAHDR